MGAIAISMVKNEADVIEASIRHNLHFVDAYAVIDNGSTDGTLEILRAMRNEGLPIVIFNDPQFGHFQSEKVTEVYRRTVPIFQPEWVYLVDADEFIRASSRTDLETRMQRVPLGGAALIPWTTHIPDPRATPEALLRDPLGSSPWRRRREEPVYFKAVVRRRAEDDLQLVIEQGNHGVRLKDERTVPTVLIEGAWISHLPVRSAGQISTKVVNGWHALLVRNRTRNQPDEAYQWKEIYDRLMGGQSLSPQDVTSIALGYAQWAQRPRALTVDAELDATAPRYGELRYIGLGKHDALARLALSMAQQLSQGHGEAAIPSELLSCAMDLGALEDVIARANVRDLAVVEREPEWARLIACSRLAWPQAELCSAQLVLAPQLSIGRFARLASIVPAGAERRVVWWSDCTDDLSELPRALDAWKATGWEPDLLETLTLRALAVYRVARQTGFVLRAVDSSRQEHARQVRQALEAMTASAGPWPEPAPRAIVHPLDNLELAPAQPLVRAAGVHSPHRHDKPTLRVAVITPYFKEPAGWLERCVESVKAQSHACTHLVIADGHPQDWLDHAGVRHIRLDRAHADFGNTPRAIGAQLAVSEGFDAVAFLDADNWYAPDHIEGCLETAKEAGADYVVSLRELVREDGTALPFRPRQDETREHVDTSCFMILPGAFHTLPRWLMMPKPMSMLGDRYYLKSLRDEGLTEGRNPRRTVRYLCGWADVYRAVGERPPAFAKEGLDFGQVRNWLQALSPKEAARVRRLTGCEVEAECRVLAQVM